MAESKTQVVFRYCSPATEKPCRPERKDRRGRPMSRLGSEHVVCELRGGLCGFTRGGTRPPCRNKVRTVLPYCWQHLKEVYGVRAAKSSIEGAGRGLWAAREFNREEVIGEYTGDILEDAALDARYPSKHGVDKKTGKRTVTDYTAPYTMTTNMGDGNPDRHVDSACARGFVSLINHNTKRKANVEFVTDDRPGGDGKLLIRALKRIPEGVEMFAWYGSDYRLGERDVANDTKRVRRARR